MPAPSLRLTHPHRRTCCEKTSRNSQNFLMIRNCPNYALTLVSWRKLGKDNSLLHWRKKDLRLCRRYVESTHYLEIQKHPEREGGFVETRKSAQSCMWRSTFMKDVIVLISWLNPYFETKQFPGSSLPSLSSLSRLPQRNWRLWETHTSTARPNSSPSSGWSMAANSATTKRPNNHEPNNFRCRTEEPRLPAWWRRLRTHICPIPKRTTHGTSASSDNFAGRFAALENHPASQRSVATRGEDWGFCATRMSHTSGWYHLNACAGLNTARPRHQRAENIEQSELHRLRRMPSGWIILRRSA